MGQQDQPGDLLRKLIIAGSEAGQKVARERTIEEVKTTIGGQLLVSGLLGMLARKNPKAHAGVLALSGIVLIVTAQQAWKKAS